MLTIEGSDNWFAVKEDGNYISDACVEGTEDHFRVMAVALRERKSMSEKRCAAIYDEDSKTFALYSPRNTQGGYANIDHDQANELANNIDFVLALESLAYKVACDEIETAVEQRLEKVTMTLAMCEALLTVLKRANG